MKLSELIAFEKRLESIIMGTTHGIRFHEYRDSMTELITSSSAAPDFLVKPIVDGFAQITKLYLDIGEPISNLHGYLLTKIKQRQDELHVESQKEYVNDTHWFKLDKDAENTQYVDYIKRYQMTINDDDAEMIELRLKAITDWKYPGMMFRPFVGKQYLQNLVASDPLYLLDHSKNLLLESIKVFPKLYQRRLRLYEIDDTLDDFMATLPDNQFGFVFAYYFFNFKPQSVVLLYLQQVWKKLRPGGIFAFSLNDCDYAENAALAETKYAHFNSGAMLIGAAEEIGYEVYYQYHTTRELHWFELRKPGELSSLRGGQSLAQVHVRQKELF